MSLLQYTTETSKRIWFNQVRTSLKKTLGIKKNTKNELINALVNRLNIKNISKDRLSITNQNIQHHRNNTHKLLWGDPDHIYTEKILLEADTMFRKGVLDWGLIKLINLCSKYTNNICGLCQDQPTLNLGHLKKNHKIPIDLEEEDIESMVRRVIEYTAFSEDLSKDNLLEVISLKKICKEYLNSWNLCRTRRDSTLKDTIQQRKTTRNKESTLFDSPLRYIRRN